MLESSHIAFAFNFQTCFPISKSLWSGFIFSSSLALMSRHIQKERERERPLWACHRQTQWKCSLVYISTEPSHAINHVFVWAPIWVRSCFNNKLKMPWGAELVQKSLSIHKCRKFVPFLRGFHGRNWVFFRQISIESFDSLLRGIFEAFENFVFELDFFFFRNQSLPPSHCHSCRWGPLCCCSWITQPGIHPNQNVCVISSPFLSYSGFFFLNLGLCLNKSQ